MWPRVHDDRPAVQRPRSSSPNMDGTGHNAHYHVGFWRPLHEVSHAPLTNPCPALRLYLPHYARDRSLLHHDADDRVLTTTLSPRTARRDHRALDVYDAYSVGTRRLLDAHQRAGHLDALRADSSLGPRAAAWWPDRVLRVHLRRIRPVEHGPRMGRGRGVLNLQAGARTAAVQDLALVHRRAQRRVCLAVLAASHGPEQLVLQGIWRSLVVHRFRPLDRNVRPEYHWALGWFYLRTCQASNSCSQGSSSRKPCVGRPREECKVRFARGNRDYCSSREPNV